MPENQHTHTKLLRFGVWGGVKECQNLTYFESFMVNSCFDLDL